jgi:beta-lactamase regulating signal transducer with metallopeptidase domain
MASNLLFTWLVNGALASTVLLVCGAAVVLKLRHPADKLRVIQWTIGATIISLVLVSVPSFSLLSLGVVSSGSTRAKITSDGAIDFSMASVGATNDANDGAFTPPVANVAPRAETRQVTTESLEPDVRHFDWKTEATWLICLAYIAGMFAFLVRWAIARVRLQRILKNARPTPSDIRSALLRIANVGSDGVLLLASDDVSTPIMCGARRPAIVLPSSVLSDDDKTQLRYYLAHEWAHVSQRHFATWQLATVLQFFLYYQPLFWWLRRQLSTSMDQLADAAACGVGDSTVDYAEFLVQLARRQLAPAPQLTLGIHDKHSPLRRRVVFLLESAVPRRLFGNRKTTFAIGAAAIGLGILVSAVRLDADPANANSDKQPKQSENAAETAKAKETAKPATPAKKAMKAETITYTGTVTDRVTGKPIAGAKVEVRHMLSRDPKTGRWITIEVTEHISDADGKYSFTLPPEQAAEDSLYLEVDAHHPEYAAKGRSGYSHAMIRKNLALGEQPFYSQIELWPGEPIFGKVVSPEGEPLADVDVSMYSSAKESKSLPRGSFDNAKTDANGVFRIVPPKDGDGVLWIKPADYSPQAHRIGNRRGDWGNITVQKGTTVSGRVLDVKGAAVAGVRIEARRRGDGEKPDEFLNNNAVANQIGRMAVSGLDGTYSLAPLPEGEYEIQVSAKTEGYDPQPLQQVFVRQKLAISEGIPQQELEIRAVPHVVIRATVLSSAGKPRSGHQQTLFGRMDGGFYAEQSSTPGKDGKFEVRAPHGLQGAELDLITNEHSALRWRMSHDAPMRRGRRVKLGTLEDDISGIEIIRYTAPILLVKPVDEQGAPLKDCTPILKYTRPDQEKEEMTVYTTGSHVSFEHQQDGRWRSEQALPNEPMNVRVEKTGYTTTPQEVSLKEGEEREFVFVMKKTGEAKAEGK